MTYIYGLIDPRTDQLRYVGKTRGALHSRLLAHINDVKRGRVYIPRHKWISELISEGAAPEIFEIETVSDDLWRDAEQFWISYFKAIGSPLLNATGGGDGLCSYRHTEETRRKQSEAARLRYESAEERRKTGAAVRRGQNNPFFLERVRAARANLSDESRLRMSEAAKKHRGTPEARAAMSALKKGRIVSDETRKRLSEKARGRVRSVESREKQAATMRGRKHSESTKAKMRMTARLRTRHAK